MRGVRLLAGILFVAIGAGGLFTTSGAQLEGFAAGGAAAAGMVFIVAGVLLVLSGLRRHSAPSFDPQATLNAHPWPNDEQPWSVGEAFGMSFWTFRKIGGKLAVPSIPAPIVMLLGAVAAALLARFAERRLSFGSAPNKDPFGGTGGPFTVEQIAAGAGILVSLVIILSIILPVLVKLTLAALRSETVSWADAKGTLRFIPRMFAASQLILLAMLLSAPLVFLPAMPLLLMPFFIVDQDLSVFAALRKSWRVGSSHFGKIWLMMVGFVPLYTIGTVTYFGMIVTIPMMVSALAYAYARSTGRNGMPYFPTEAGSEYVRRFLRTSLVALTGVFAVLIFWVEHLPKRRGMAFNALEAALRANTIIVQIVVVVVMLSLILPYVLDQLEGRRFTTFVAARHVRSQKSGFLTVISVLSICGVAISSCALSSVVSVMGGFSQDLRRKILGSGAHIVVDTTAGTAFGDYEKALERIRKIPGVVGATPVVHGEVMASSASNLAGVVVTGIEPASSYTVIDLVSNIEVGRINYLEHPELLTHLPADEVIGMGPGGERYYKGAELAGVADDIDPAVRAVLLPSKPDRPGIVLGRELAKTLHVYVGDEITLVSPLGDLGPMGVMPRTKRFRVAAIFYSGMYEYDATFVYTMMDTAQDYFQTAQNVSALEIKVEDAERVDRELPLVIKAVGRDDLRVRDWREINKNLFSALKLERFATFIILSLAILVASFCIICTLLLMVTEKGKEIAILKAIGATDGDILRTFIIEGMIIGGIGMMFGVVTSVAFATGVQWYGLLLDPEVYYIDKLPISVNAADFLAVAAAALFICALSTLYPAYAASKLRPVDGLRDA